MRCKSDKLVPFRLEVCNAIPAACTVECPCQTPQVSRNGVGISKGFFWMHRHDSSKLGMATQQCCQPNLPSRTMEIGSMVEIFGWIWSDFFVPSRHLVKHSFAYCLEPLDPSTSTQNPPLSASIFHHGAWLHSHLVLSVAWPSQRKVGSVCSK